MMVRISHVWVGVWEGRREPYRRGFIGIEKESFVHAHSTVEPTFSRQGVVASWKRWEQCSFCALMWQLG